MRNKFIQMLSLLLAFCLLLSTIVYASTGDTTSGRKPSGFGAGASVGDTGLNFYRMRAFRVDGSGNVLSRNGSSLGNVDNTDYFRFEDSDEPVIESPDGNIGGELSVPDRIGNLNQGYGSNPVGYYDADEWVYFGLNTSAKQMVNHQVFADIAGHTTSAGGAILLGYDEISSFFGKSGSAYSNYDVVNKLIRDYIPSQYADCEFSRFFNLTAEYDKSFFVVVESLLGINIHDTWVLVSVDTFNNSSNLSAFNSYYGTSTHLNAWDRLSANNTLIKMGDVVPFNASWAGNFDHNLPRNFGLYGDLSGKGVSSRRTKAAMNVVVEYKGDPGTSDGSKFYHVSRMLSDSDIFNSYDGVNIDDNRTTNAGLTTGTDLVDYYYYTDTPGPNGRQYTWVAAGGDLNNAYGTVAEEVNASDVVTKDEEYGYIWGNQYMFFAGQDIPLSYMNAWDKNSGGYFGSLIKQLGILWSNTLVTGSPKNVGFRYEPLKLEGGGGGADEGFLEASDFTFKTMRIWNIVANGIGAFMSGTGTDANLEQAFTTYVNPTLSNIDNIDYTYGQVFGKRTSQEPIALDREKGTLYYMANENLGVAIEFLVKGQPITSHRVSITIDASGMATSAETYTLKYNTAKSGIMPLSPSALACIVVPNFVRNDAAITAAMMGQNEATNQQLINIFTSTFPENRGAWTNVGEIGLGSESFPEGTPLDGYTVYEVILGDMPIEVEGALELPSFMLNRYFANVIETSAMQATGGILFEINVHKDYTHDYDAYSDIPECPRGDVIGDGTNNFETRSDTYKNYEIEWSDISSDGKIINWDAGTLLGRYFPSMDETFDSDTPVWHKAQRELLANRWADDNTEFWEGTYTNAGGDHRMEYGFNLIRAAFDDLRSISGIEYVDYEGGFGDADNMLQIKDKFDVIPKSVKLISIYRDPLAVVGDVDTETLKFTSRFKLYHGVGWQTDNDDEQHLHHHDGVEADEDEDTEVEEGEDADDTEGGEETGALDPVDIYYWHLVKDRDCLGFSKTGAPGGVAGEVMYTWNNIAYKYQTNIIATGLNRKLNGRDYMGIPLATQNIGVDLAKDSNEYRYSYVRPTGATLYFYPEVRMLSLLGTTKWSEIKDMQYSATHTMGEEKRSAQQTSLYLYKINAENTDTTTGTTYSDALLGGTGALTNSGVSLSGQTPIIPAGTDVTVKADPSGVSIDLYGYALDVISDSKDATFDAGTVGSPNNRAYEDVVKSGMSVVTKWGDTGTYTAAENEFKDWVNEILNLNNYGVDFTLYVNGTEVAKNFSATVGRISKVTPSLQNTYQLVVENGEVTTMGDYNAMITQISKDYDVSFGTAENLFAESGIATAILEGIESSTSSFNHSGQAIIGATNATSALGNGTNWYDEKTYTFVVRRFVSEGNKFQNIIATDKIDYDLAPTGTVNDKQNANAGRNFDAHWKYTIYFDERSGNYVEGSLIGAPPTYYDPGVAGNSLDAANSGRTIIVNKEDVNNADFRISAQATSNFQN